MSCGHMTYQNLINSSFFGLKCKKGEAMLCHVPLHVCDEESKLKLTSHVTMQHIYVVDLAIFFI